MLWIFQVSEDNAVVVANDDVSIDNNADNTLESDDDEALTDVDNDTLDSDEQAYAVNDDTDGRIASNIDQAYVLADLASSVSPGWHQVPTISARIVNNAAVQIDIIDNVLPVKR
jgi:hypothetical protein